VFLFLGFMTVSYEHLNFDGAATSIFKHVLLCQPRYDFTRQLITISAGFTDMLVNFTALLNQGIPLSKKKKIGKF